MLVRWTKNLLLAPVFAIGTLYALAYASIILTYGYFKGQPPRRMPPKSQ